MLLPTKGKGEVIAMKLLLADQNRDILLMYRALFAGRGDDVISAFDGAQVADYLREEDFDLMIVNYDIPRVRAAQLIRMAKEKQTPAITLVNTTEYAGVKTEEIASASIMFPFFPEELFAKVDEVSAGHADDARTDGEMHA